MTATCMNWLLRLIRLKNNKGQSFIEHFARHMYTHTEGVPRDCWQEVATWAGMPELLVDMTLEVEIDALISKPMNALFYEVSEGRPCGFVLHKMPRRVHEVWRPLIERLASDPLSELSHTAVAIERLADPRLRELKTKQVHLACQAAKKEFKKLYEFVYGGHMLFLWLWYPAYSRSAARALCNIIGLTGSTTLDLDDEKDEFMRKCFEDNKDIVRQLWIQYRMTDEECVEILEMTHTDNGFVKQDDLAAKYPHFDMFLFLKYAALCTANHYIEGTFSNHSTTLRTNMSDGRLDRKMRYDQNIAHKIKKKVLVEATARMVKKGCAASHVTPVGTKDDCRHICRIKKQILESMYVCGDCDGFVSYCDE